MSAVLSLVTTPISVDVPFGTNINYEPVFDTLKNEIGKPGNIDLTPSLLNFWQRLFVFLV